MPQSDAEDFSRGASHIPYEVTEARRRGEKVTFVQSGDDSSAWYWEMPDGSHVR